MKLNYIGDPHTDHRLRTAAAGVEVGEHKHRAIGAHGAKTVFEYIALGVGLACNRDEAVVIDGIACAVTARARGERIGRCGRGPSDPIRRTRR